MMGQLLLTIWCLLLLLGGFASCFWALFGGPDWSVLVAIIALPLLFLSGAFLK